MCLSFTHRQICNYLPHSLRENLLYKAGHGCGLPRAMSYSYSLLLNIQKVRVWSQIMNIWKTIMKLKSLVILRVIIQVFKPHGTNNNAYSPSQVSCSCPDPWEEQPQCRQPHLQDWEGGGGGGETTSLK